jgi:hypothetical protein
VTDGEGVGVDVNEGVAVGVADGVPVGESVIVGVSDAVASVSDVGTGDGVDVGVVDGEALGVVVTVAVLGGSKITRNTGQLTNPPAEPVSQVKRLLAPWLGPSIRKDTRPPARRRCNSSSWGCVSVKAFTRPADSCPALIFGDRLWITGAWRSRS